MRAGDRKKVALIATSDWHFRLTAPRARVAVDWMITQFEALNQIAELADAHQCPVVIAGDVFDDGHRSDKCPPELVNEACEFLRLFPKVYAVAGQHDLPNHRLDLIGKSALRSLENTGAIELLRWEHPRLVGEDLVLVGFSWGETSRQGIPDPSPHRVTYKSGSRPKVVAALHAYCWNDDSTRHKDAHDKDHALNWQKRMKGYDVAILGDNHKGFLRLGNNATPTIYNTGGPMNRNIDEKGANRHVGLIYADGTVEKYYLDTSAERWRDAEEVLAAATPLGRTESEEFLKELADCGTEFFDFCGSVLRHMRKTGVRSRVRELVTEILKAAKDGEGR